MLACRDIYALPECDSASPDSEEVRRRLLQLQEDFINCPPAQRIAVASQVALKRLGDHLRDLRASDPKLCAPSVELTRPVYEDTSRKLQQKHDLWKKTYKPAMSLNALLCLLS